MPMLCDAHIHFIPEELSRHTSFYKGAWTDKEKLFAFLERYRIAKALLVYPSTDAAANIKDNDYLCRLYNDAVSEIVSCNQRIVGTGLVNVDDPSTLAEQARRLKERGFGAINLSSSYQGKFMVKELELLFHAAADIGLPIFVHPQTINPIGFDRVNDPLLMPVLEYSFDSSMFLGLLMTEGVLQKYEAKFIFSSLGGVVPFLKDRFDRIYTMLRGRGIVKDLGSFPSQILRNVYVDTSGNSFSNILMAIDLFGADKILWGSDYPVCGDLDKDLSMLEELGPQVKGDITGRNFLSLFPSDTR
ncbi:MAG: amidohydrolase [Candidatus Omnitrophica bacterium]|nr:amidohydrolase [Candidatus Omnitrophota bacterium]